MNNTKIGNIIAQSGKNFTRYLGRIVGTQQIKDLYKIGEESVRQSFEHKDNLVNAKGEKVSLEQMQQLLAQGKPIEEVMPQFGKGEAYLMARHRLGTLNLNHINNQFQQLFIKGVISLPVAVYCFVMALVNLGKSEILLTIQFCVFTTLFFLLYLKNCYQQACIYHRRHITGAQFFSNFKYWVIRTKLPYHWKVKD